MTRRLLKKCLLVALSLVTLTFALARTFGWRGHKERDASAVVANQPRYIPLGIVKMDGERRLEVVRIDCSSPDVVASVLSGSCRLQLGFVDGAALTSDEPDAAVQQGEGASIWERLGIIAPRSGEIR